MKKPNDITIERWMNGLLEGDDLKAVEMWAEANPKELEDAMGWAETGSLLRREISASQEPPYADFFNRKLEREILKGNQVVPTTQSKFGFWQKFGWLMAPVAVAGMAVCFYIGSTLREQTGVSMAGGSEVYIPQEGVTAEVHETESVTVIALNGLDEIPDTLDIVNGETSAEASKEYYVRLEGDNLY